MAYFSSRGPIVAGDGNLLKPDITAPGMSVVAQVPNYNSYTSRSLSGALFLPATKPERCKELPHRTGMCV
jgi:hypothetical protein